MGVDSGGCFFGFIEAVVQELPPFFESSFCVKSLSVEVFMCFVV